MSKFIRLTAQNGNVFYLATAVLEAFSEREGGGTNFAISGSSKRFDAQETPEQILALIEGDESGLRDRVAFLERALWQAVNKTGMHFEQQTIMTEGAGWFSGDTPELKQWLNDCGVIL